MTCIVGIRHSGGGVLIGGDSAGVDGWGNVTARKDPKVFRVGELVMGCTSSYRMIQLLRFNLAEQIIPPDEDLFGFMVSGLIPKIRKAFSDGGFMKSKDSVELGGTFLIGVRNQLFKIEGDYQVGEPMDAFDACGSGAEVARGALTVGMNFGQVSPDRESAHQLAGEALRAAVACKSSVRGPFVFEETSPLPHVEAE